MHIADTLSRAFLPGSTDELINLDLDILHLEVLPNSPSKLDAVQHHTRNDPDLQPLRDVLLNGWPAERTALPESL